MERCVLGTRRDSKDHALHHSDEGVGEADLARLHAPIGIQIGARTPEEVAVTIAAQLIESNVVARAKRVGSVAHATDSTRSGWTAKSKAAAAATGAPSSNNKTRKSGRRMAKA